MPFQQMLSLGYDLIIKHTKLPVTTNLEPKLCWDGQIMDEIYSQLKNEAKFLNLPPNKHFFLEHVNVW